MDRWETLKDRVIALQEEENGVSDPAWSAYDTVLGLMNELENG